MPESSPRVALLFDDEGLAAQLRTALHEHGATIAHEGAALAFTLDELRRTQASVLVVNLDDDDLEVLDHVHALAAQVPVQLLFNDAQASRGLDGWDRARWARHLAVKALASGDIDPPRPEDAPAFESQLPSPSPPPSPTSELDEDAAPPAPIAASADEVQVETENLAAELEALLSADAFPAEDDFALGSTLKFAEAEPPLLHDGDFGATVEAEATTPSLEVEPAATAEPAAPKVDIDALTQGLSLLEIDDGVVEPSKASTPTVPVHAALAATADWSLLDVDTPTTTDAATSSRLLIGTEAEPALVASHDGQLAAERPRKLVVVGAVPEGDVSLARFVTALPATLDVPVLLVRHLREAPAPTIGAQLAKAFGRPVPLIKEGDHLLPGALYLMPADTLELDRDGRVHASSTRSSSSGIASQPQPSITHIFTQLAAVFGKDLLAVVFDGKATDAVAGAQAIHDRGGQVWAEQIVPGQPAGMVRALQAERLAGFQGTPEQLATRLIEEIA